MTGAKLTMPGLGEFEISSLTLQPTGEIVITVGGPSQNGRDKTQSASSRSTSGRNNPRKLTAQDVRQIRSTWSKQESHDGSSRIVFEQTMAKRYGTSPTNIDHVIMRRTWKHVR